MKLNNFRVGTALCAVLTLAGWQTTMPHDYCETLTPVNDASGNNYVSYQFGKGSVQAWQESLAVSSVKYGTKTILFGWLDS